jgi:outer membrane protein assembly factor BamD
VPPVIPPPRAAFRPATGVTQWARRAVAALLLALPLLALAGCAAKSDDDDASSKGPKEPVEQIYNEGLDALNARKFDIANKKFNQLQSNYPFSPWAASAQLMLGYSQYLAHKYTDSEATLDRFIQLHPTSKDVAYAYYLRALNFYEQITDIQRDQKVTEQALADLKEVVNRFPDSAYARDARLKIDLCLDHLAGKEMAIGRWYQNQKLYAAAINRYQRVVQDYQKTNMAPEALYRLTEIYMLIGLPDQAKKSAAVLEHNYPNSEWYRDSWNLLVADHQVSGKMVGQSDNGGFFQRTFGWIF